MADLRPQHTEEAVGANHPTKTDVINRAWNVEHDEDGLHTISLKAIDYQDATPTNFDYEHLRMECGHNKVTRTGATSASVSVTFGTAFAKLLAAFITFTSTDETMTISADMDHIYIGGEATTKIDVYLIDDAGGLQVGEVAYFYWIAIGV